MVSKEKITNANSFPKDWPIKKLADIGSTYGGLTNKSKEDFTEGNSKFITYKNIYNNTFINTNELESVRIDKDEKQNKVKYGDVFFTGSSETPDEVGISSVLLEEVDDVYLNSFCFGFRFNDLKKTIPEFYGYYFRGPVFRNEVYPLAQGSTRFNLSKSEMVKLKVPVPPVKEQYKIAAIISSVDKAIEKTEAIIEQTEKVKKGLMQQLFTKGIGHTKFKKTEIGEIPEEWQIFALGDLCLLGPQNGVYKEKSEYGRGYQIVVLNDLYENEYFIAKPLDNLIDLSDKELSNYSLQEDDILVNRVSKQVEGVAKMTLFKLNNNKAVFESNMIRIRLDTKKCLPLFCLFFSHSDIYKKQIMKVAKVSSQTSISQDGIKNIRVPVPPITEQYQIVSIIESIIQKEDKEKEKLNYLQKFKKGLMQVLLTGKVRVKVDDEVMSQ
jgi:type I restriction enzyme, S subunit